MSELNSKHSPNNQLGKPDKSTEKQRKNKISLEEKLHVKAPNTLVPFENCIRVKNDYFFEYNNELTAINKDVLNTDYGQDTVNKIRKYLKFINHPEHVNYQK